MTIGYLTAIGPVCLDCITTTLQPSIERDALFNGNAPDLSDPIEDPAPHGVRLHDAKHADLYSIACNGCGWSIRRVPKSEAGS